MCKEPESACACAVHDQQLGRCCAGLQLLRAAHTSPQPFACSGSMWTPVDEIASIASMPGVSWEIAVEDYCRHGVLPHMQGALNWTSCKAVLGVRDQLLAAVCANAAVLGCGIAE